MSSPMSQIRCSLNLLPTSEVWALMVRVPLSQPSPNPTPQHLASTPQPFLIFYIIYPELAPGSISVSKAYIKMNTNQRLTVTTRKAHSTVQTSQCLFTLPREIPSARAAGQIHLPPSLIPPPLPSLPAPSKEDQS